MNKILVKFELNCGRNGTIESLFISTKEELDSIIGKNMEFYEILGKHSQIFDTVSLSHFNTVTEDQNTIEILENCLGEIISGINIFEHISN